MKTVKSKSNEAPTRIGALSVAYAQRWWKGQSLAGDKGGNFNMDHYIQVCEAKDALGNGTSSEEERTGTSSGEELQRIPRTGLLAEIRQHLQARLRDF